MIMRKTSVLLVALVLALGGCGGGEKKDDGKASGEHRDGTATLCDRLGGKDALDAVVKDFVENGVAKDERINARFAKTDIPHLELMLGQQLEEAAGCPDVKYAGRDMKSVHQGMGISMGEFNALVEDLGKALDRHGAKPADRDELLGKLDAFKDQIVEKP